MTQQLHPWAFTAEKKNLMSHVSTAPLFVTAHNWKQKYPSVGQWLNSLWYIHAVEYNSAIQRNSVYMTLPK